MNCSRVQDSFIDYQDGTLPADEAAQLRAHLTSCPTCQREWSALQEITRKLDTLSAAEEPSPRLREQFYAMLETHQREADAPSPFTLARGRIDRFFAALLPAQPALQFAFSLALLIGGLYAGQRFLTKPVAPVDDSARKELADLRKQMDSLNLAVTDTWLLQKSTSERMKTVLDKMDLKSPDRKVLSDLVSSLAFDPSINVRLSVVEALAQHADDSLVRTGVLNALPREHAPLVQVAMIELLAGARDQAAEPVFEKLSRDEALDPNVRSAARRALAALRLPASPETDPAAATKKPLKPSLT